MARRRGVMLTVVVLCLGLVSPALARTREAGREDRKLAEIKSATARYADVKAAEADGYEAVSPCVAHPTDGAMGIHYLNYNLAYSKAEQDVIDLKRPELLLYEPVDGGLQLVSVEYLKIDDDQSLETDDDRPRLFGTHAFDGPMPGHEPGMPAHYEVHVWVHKANPVGMYAPWNPDVHCPAGPEGGAAH